MATSVGTEVRIKGQPRPIRKTDMVLLSARPGQMTWSLRNTDTYAETEAIRMKTLERYRDGWHLSEPETRFKIGPYALVGRLVSETTP